MGSHKDELIKSIHNTESYCERCGEELEDKSEEICDDCLENI
ncbi:hypothetical protein RH915_05895 [Serpentinicella sp. ANB-PHB4]|nr:hypothetical protein [Serpentinicella sp. ANB-PHB4]MDR5659015.1 hypothetical protein [Serpentinicella sp. ANB-PHB4]